MKKMKKKNHSSIKGYSLASCTILDEMLLSLLFPHKRKPKKKGLGLSSPTRVQRKDFFIKYAGRRLRHGTWASLLPSTHQQQLSGTTLWPSTEEAWAYITTTNNSILLIFPQNLLRQQKHDLVHSQLVPWTRGSGGSRSQTSLWHRG